MYPVLNPPQSRSWSLSSSLRWGGLASQ